eukprot:1328591-Pleurochrysis_carterae.AAC.1
MHVRSGLRRSRIAADAALHKELSELRSELLSTRRDAYYAKSLRNQKAKVDELQSALGERDKTIGLLQQKLLALEKCDALQRRKLSNVSNIMDTHASKQKAREGELAQQLKDSKAELAKLRTLRDAELKAQAQRTQQLQNEAKQLQIAAKVEAARIRTEAKAAAELSKSEAKQAAAKLKQAEDGKAKEAAAAWKLSTTPRCSKLSGA